MNKLFTCAGAAVLTLLSTSAFAQGTASHQIELQGNANARCSVPAYPTKPEGDADLLSGATAASSTVLFNGFTTDSGRGNASTATLQFAGVWCNQAATMELTSNNRGLDAGEPAPPGFVSKVHYIAEADWAGGVTDLTLDTSTGDSASDETEDANAGDLVVKITTVPDATKLLLAGHYEDALTISITPIL